MTALVSIAPPRSGVGFTGLRGVRQSDPDPGIGLSASTTYVLIWGRPCGPGTTSQVCSASKPSHPLFGAGGFQIVACPLTTTLRSAPSGVSAVIRTDTHG